MLTLIITMGLVIISCTDGNCSKISWTIFEAMTGLELLIEVGILRVYRKR